MPKAYRARVPEGFPVPRLRRPMGWLCSVLLALPLAGLLASPAAAGPEYRRITFPVRGEVSYTDTFGACRDGCSRLHEGQDLMGSKLQRLLATVDGRVSWLRSDASGLSGNMLAIEDADGFEYRYMHINNDAPGTDDGSNPPEWVFAPGIRDGARVRAGQVVAYMGDSGNAEGTAPHLHFEIRRPDGSAMNPWASLRLAQGLEVDGRCSYPERLARDPSRRAGRGYWVADRRGGVHAYGAARSYGSAAELRLAAPVTEIWATATGAGYWLLGEDGGIFTYGNARFYGSTGAMRLDAPIVSMAPTPTGRGYWLLGRDGGVFTFGNARFYGSLGGQGLRVPVVAMAPTPSGRGYWLAAQDGSVYTFGDAAFFGSKGGQYLRMPIVRIAATPTGRGYWLLARDGGVFAFGDARYHGSLPGTGRCSPGTVRGMASTLTGGGYWVVKANGRVRAYGDGRRYGDPHRLGVSAAGLAVLPRR